MQFSVLLTLSALSTNVLIAYRGLIVHKNTIAGEFWCFLLPTRAVLLGNGQTYATLGVPYNRVSRIFMSCIFMSRNFHTCTLVPQIHVSHFKRPHHLLHSLLADKNSHGCDLRRRRHDRILSHNDDQRNFVHRQIHKYSY